MWLPRWVGEVYKKLYTKFNREIFYFDDVLDISKSFSSAKVVLYELRKVGAVYVHGRVGKKRAYRLCDPEVLLYILDNKISNLGKFKQGRYSRVIGLVSVEILKRFSFIVNSLVVYGSVARGVARADSDIDLLVILDSKDSFGKRIDMLLDVEFSEKVSEELNWLYNNGIDTHISFLPLNLEEVKAFPPILLDVIDEGVVLVDKGFYSKFVIEKKAYLSKLGARRVFLSESEWYWDFKPGIKFGEVVEV
ncbi:MAG: nucleotidyltransferase domain-containing protein [Nitrososphaeria archaeon]|nr:nucleotidyltransferase domain-containing protein [Nitrososphaeria archaeon]